MRVIVNGTSTVLDEGASLGDLLATLGLGARWVVAERNGEAVVRTAMATVLLADGDRIELVRAVAGG